MYKQPLGNNPHNLNHPSSDGRGSVCCCPGYPCPFGYSPAQGEFLRDHEAWRRSYSWALARYGIFPHPVLPPAERGFQDNQLCCVEIGNVEAEQSVSGLEVWRAARWWRRFLGGQ